ncbi:MAG: hypothetical protein J7J94_02140 [Thaumarchaeota archaeon]|nr:hypothetical protein [Nitrososphaerota archaeon]
MRKARSRLSDDQAWIISTLILVFFSVIFYVFPVFQKTFYLFVFVFPTIVSIPVSIYLAIQAKRKNNTQRASERISGAPQNPE